MRLVWWPSVEAPVDPVSMTLVAEGTAARISTTCVFFMASYTINLEGGGSFGCPDDT